MQLDVKLIIDDFEKALIEFAGCEKDFRGSMPPQEQLRIFNKFSLILDNIKRLNEKQHNQR